MSDATFPTQALICKEETQARQFIEEFPEYDGRGVVVAVFDSGVDPGTPGLQVTSHGLPKIIDIIDATGCGDVDTTTIRKAKEAGDVKTIEGLSGRTLYLGQHFDSPTGEYRVGIKAAFDLYPQVLVKRIKEERKKEFDEKQRKLIETLNRQIQQATATSVPSKSELETRLEQAKALSYDDPGPVYDVVLFKDKNGYWKAAIDTSETGDFTSVKPMGEYRFNQEYGTLSKKDMLNYVFNVYDDGNILSIVTNGGSHGTHVASIIGAYHKSQPELNGVAPGCQIISIQIGDQRLDTMETGVGLVRAMIAAKNAKVDIINMSYGEGCARPDFGRVADFANELVFRHGVVFLASASNSGPALSTAGAPGGFTSGIIGVGAVATPEMCDVLYSSREPTKTVQLYTWSSRGPAPDGAYGASICAPGGAFAGVPNWTLQKSHMMNGTSMSSPNAAGCVALLLSALKAKKISYSPWLVRRALENTAAPIDKFSPLDYGFGMVQVKKALQWFEKNKWGSNVRLDVRVQGHNANKARGIYYREPHQTSQERTEIIEVNPVWNENASPEEKIAFEKRFVLKSTAEWISVPNHFVLTNAARTFAVQVNPTVLKPGNIGDFYHAQVQGYDTEHPDHGPMFVVPVTCIKPIPPSPPPCVYSFNDLALSPGVLYRRFFVVPEGASVAKVTLKAKKNFEKRLVVFAALCLAAPHSSTKFTLVDEYIRMKHEEERVKYVSVTQGRTLEIVIGQYWNSLGDKGLLDVTVEFRGVQVDATEVTLTSYEEIKRVNVRTLVANSEILNTTANLAVLQRILYPTETSIKPLSADRDKWSDERLIYQLINTYTFQTFDGVSKYIFRVPNFSSILYESPQESQFWMVFDENKRRVAAGDAWPEFVTLSKGKYTVRVQFRSDDMSVIEKMKQYALLLEAQLPKEKNISLSLYNSQYAALTNGTKIGKSLQVEPAGAVQSIFVTAPSSSSIPSYAEPGDVLLGTMRFIKLSDVENEATNSRGISLGLDGIPVRFVVPPAKPKSASSSSTSTSNTSALSIAELQSKFVVDHLNSLVNGNKHAEALRIIPELSAQVAEKDKLQFLAIKMRCLDATITDFNQRETEVIAAADAVIELIDQNQLAAFLGVRHTPEESEATKAHEELKKTLIEALKLKALVHSQQLAKLKPPVSEDDLKEVQAVLNELKKWVDTDASPEFAELNIRLHRAKGNIGMALKLVRKEITNSKQKPKSKSKKTQTLNSDGLRHFYELEIELLKQLEFTHWASLAELWLIHRYPPNYTLF